MLADVQGEHNKHANQETAYSNHLINIFTKLF